MVFNRLARLGPKHNVAHYLGGSTGLPALAFASASTHTVTLRTFGSPRSSAVGEAASLLA